MLFDQQSIQKVAWVQTILHLGLGFTNEQDTLTLDRGAMHQRSNFQYMLDAGFKFMQLHDTILLDTFYYQQLK